MGFSFRGRGKAADTPVSEGQATGHDASPDMPIDINPEADLKKFKQLHKWDPFMEVDKLDAADQVRTTRCSSPPLLKRHTRV